MSRILKTALLWFLLVAVPAQGYAAATMLLCGPLHERMGNQAVDDHHGLTAHDHAAGGATSGQDGHHSTEADSSNPLNDRSGDLQVSGCSACAACSVGAAMIVSAVALSLPDLAIEPIFATSLPQIGFFTDGPQRPPRTILA